jgi:hypothetical protein
MIWRPLAHQNGSTQPFIPSVCVKGEVCPLHDPFALSGTGGMANTNYYLLASTNMATPLINWTRLLANPFDTSGNFIFTNPLNPNWPQRFYRLQLP